ncbi:MAG: hypothetical protein BGO67_00125 [Alphaproteobacteria bacterium 41-28]|nr:MAG: hypothetical protein BGO67_00125 [Alphaproteobacteria bacterium 41-28]
MSFVKIYDEQDRRALVEQYRIVTDSVNKLNDIRETSNNFWTGLNGALLGTIAYVKDMQSVGESPKIFFLATLVFLGIIMSFFWLMFLMNVKKSIEIRNDILIEIERFLPVKIFTYAIHIIGRKSGKGSLSVKEMIAPILFLLGYVFFAIVLYLFPRILS